MQGPSLVPKYELISVKVEDPELQIWLEKKLKSCWYKKKTQIKFHNEYCIEQDNLYSWLEKPISYEEPFVNNATSRKWGVILKWYYSDVQYGELE